MLTPKTINQTVNDLLKIMDLEDKPVFIDVHTESYSRPNFCTINVEEKVKREGGESIYGWQIWEYPFLYEAEFHAVWKSPENLLIDITPKANRPEINKILFIADSKINYTGIQIDNVRLKTRDNDLVDDLIKLKKTKYYLCNKGERATYTGEIIFKGREADVLNFTKGVEALLIQNVTYDSPCLCNSNNSFKECHGRHIKPLLKEFEAEIN